jgi:hypothetical protein
LLFRQKYCLRQVLVQRSCLFQRKGPWFRMVHQAWWRTPGARLDYLPEGRSRVTEQKSRIRRIEIRKIRFPKKSGRIVWQNIRASQ